MNKFQIIGIVFFLFTLLVFVYSKIMPILKNKEVKEYISQEDTVKTDTVKDCSVTVEHTGLYIGHEDGYYSTGNVNIAIGYEGGYDNNYNKTIYEMSKD